MEEKKPKYKTVLVIDDEEIDLFLAEKILSGANYFENIIFYNNARLAISYLENVKEMDQLPELILLDLSMPAFTGEDFLVEYHMLSDTIRSKIKLVVLTAYKYYHEAKNINSHRFPSMNKVLEKPLDIEELELV